MKHELNMILKVQLSGILHGDEEEEEEQELLLQRGDLRAALPVRAVC